MDAMTDPNTPQWKRELIKRLRYKNKWFSDSYDEQEQQLLAGNSSVELGRTVQQPNLTCSSSSATAAVVVPVVDVNVCATRKCDESLLTMVKVDCDLENCVSGDEELHYGPGIVKKLKNHYLSLTLRECNAQVRPSILPLRKATSLENLLDDGDGEATPKPSTQLRYTPRYSSKYRENEKNFTNNRYNASRGVDLKRARSVEAISRGDDLHNSQEPLNDPRVKHQSFHEDMLIGVEGNGIDNATTIIKETPFSNTVNHKVNRPKRITPLMSEKEKPPADVVKQTKRIFEGKPEQRTKQPYHTGDVAAKVASYKNIIQTKIKKPPVTKQKPVLEDKKTQPKQKPKTLENGWKHDVKSPEIGLIPDVSLIASPREETNGNPNLSETPDLILHYSPTKNVHEPVFKILATDNFLKAEVVHCNNLRERVQCNGRQDQPDSSKHTTEKTPAISHTHTPLAVTNITHFNKKLPEKKTDNFKVVSPILLTPLTLQEIEKNHINCTKTTPRVLSISPSVKESEDHVKSMEVNKNKQVPKSSLLRQPEQNSIVFKFTDRKDVPDYVYNDGKIRTRKIEKPKVGEGGIILLPGVSLDESLVDDGDDWMLILEGPPSPCDIEFINANILINGRSSIRQRSKNHKKRIKFVEAVPEIFEYPSEASFFSDCNSPTSPSIASIVPALSTGTLANYIPKVGPTEEFQLGITRSTPIVPIPTTTQNEENHQQEQDVEKPVLFSAGANADILF